MRFLTLMLFALALPADALAGGAAGGPVPAPPAGSSCLPAEQSAALRAELPPAFHAQGVQTTLYADPMPGGTNSFGRTVVNYVDLDPTTGIKDWNCGTNSYDGHTGIDIEIRDFYDMDAGVPILCAAPGVVASMHDGEFDRQTAWLSGVTANDVIVQHADGSTAYYWHMRKGSVRVAAGQAVATGDTLGFVGSSGFSSGPHLHFETYDGGTREPYAGSCNAVASRWITQLPYVWSYPFQLFGNGLTTVPLTWPLILERVPSKTHVVAGGTIYSWIRSRNLASTDLVTYQFYSPLGTIWNSYSFYPSGSYSSSWWYIYWTLPTSNTLFGAWHLDILRNGMLIASQPFTLDATPNQLPSIASRSLYVKANGSADVDLAGTDPDGTVFWHNLQTAPAHGTATLSNTRRHLLHYVPTPGYQGADSVTVFATDDENANGAASVIRFNVTSLLAVDAKAARGLELSPPSPNPARAGTRFAFRLPAAGDATLDLLDAGGRRLARWSADGLAAGPHEIAWEALAGARPVRPGLYFARLTSGGASRTQRVSVVE
jgi:murein DD-endopeptidase MepM/ murein hydrolase activator NlpD